MNKKDTNKDTNTKVHTCPKCGNGYMYIAGKGIIVMNCPNCHKSVIFWIW